MFKPIIFIHHPEVMQFVEMKIQFLFVEKDAPVKLKILTGAYFY